MLMAAILPAFPTLMRLPFDFAPFGRYAQDDKGAKDSYLRKMTM